jgi:hypothetical protein
MKVLAESACDMGEGSIKRKRNSYADSPHKLRCPYCPRAFPWISSLKRHILTHTGELAVKLSLKFISTSIYCITRSVRFCLITFLMVQGIRRESRDPSKFVLNENRTKSHNWPCWTKIRNLHFWTKNGRICRNF